MACTCACTCLKIDETCTFEAHIFKCKMPTGSTIICVMTTVKLVLDKRRKKKSGAYPLVICIRKTGKYVGVLTNQELHEHQFDDKRELVLGNKSLNKFLQREVDICKDKIIQLHQQYDEVSFEQIKALFGNKKQLDLLKLAKLEMLVFTLAV